MALIHPKAVVLFRATYCILWYLAMCRQVAGCPRAAAAEHQGAPGQPPARPCLWSRIQNLFIVVSWLISFKEIKSLILMLRCDWSENSHIDYMNLLKLFPMRGTLPESARRGMFQASRSWAALGLLLMLQETERPGGTRFNKPFWWHSCPQKC